MITIAINYLSTYPGLGRFSERVTACEKSTCQSYIEGWMDGWCWKSQRANPKSATSGRAIRSRFFSGLVMMFVIRKKRVSPRFYCGMVPTIWVKQYKERPNFWNWHVGSLEFGRLLDWLGDYERCLITQRERKTITGKAGLTPRVILVIIMWIILITCCSASI